MLLAIDAGNSHTVSGVFQDAELVHYWRVKTDRNETADELAARFHVLLAMKGLGFADIKAAVIGSVVPTQQRAWLKFTRNVGWPVLAVKGDAIRTGIRLLVENPKEVGADRIANTVAAYERYRTALIVVDFGTAITFDCISRQGDYVGGAIAPGIAISLDALAERTAMLPRVDLSSPPAGPIGITTVDAIKSGMLYGYGGLVDGLVKQLAACFDAEQPKVIATGGMADLIAPYAASIEVVEQMLTLEGLRILYERNK